MSLQSSAHVTEYRRPWRSGEPLTDRAPCVLPKPGGVVQALPAPGHLPLELADRRLFNLLLACSWRRLEDGELKPPPVIAAAVRRAIGQGGRRDNERLKPALAHLCERSVEIEGVGETPLLRRAEIDRQAVVWEFPESLRGTLMHPPVYAWFNLSHACRLRSVAGLVLYENLALRANKHWTGWTVSVDELNRLFGRGADDWAGLHKVLDAACIAVAAETELQADYETKKAPQTGRVASVSFRIRGKVTVRASHSERLDA